MEWFNGPEEELYLLADGGLARCPGDCEHADTSHGGVELLVRPTRRSQFFLSAARCRSWIRMRASAAILLRRSEGDARRPCDALIGGNHSAMLAAPACGGVSGLETTGAARYAAAAAAAAPAGTALAIDRVPRSMRMRSSALGETPVAMLAGDGLDTRA